jgi:hypothetical protein
VSTKHRPCGNCPWRKDAPVGTWTAERFQTLAQGCQHNGWDVFACHKSAEDAPFVCAGFAAVIGFDSIGLRLAAAAGRYNPDGLDTSGLELYPDFDAMLRANGVEPLPDDREAKRQSMIDALMARRRR